MTAKGNAGSDGGDNRKVVARLLFVVIGMFGFGFALVPIYDVFCEVTGLNGKTGGQASLSGAQVDRSRVITVQFLASLNESMPWDFEPLTRAVKVHPGEPMQIEYRARNRTGQPIVGSAVPSVAPGVAAPYFQKTECFCFTEQKLEAREERDMPVIFIVDPELPEEIETLTLSYTFFIKPGAETVSLAQ